RTATTVIYTLSLHDALPILVSKRLKYSKTSQGGFSMTIKTDLGYIEITSEVMAGIAGYAASSCFGVKGMTIRSMSDGLAHLLGRDRKSTRLNSSHVSISYAV